MLDDLDQIDWGNLSHCYGSAVDVPELFRRMVQPNRKIQEQAFDDLCNLINHQGSVYPATAAAIPFLLRLAANPAFALRRSVIELLVYMAPGFDNDWWNAMRQEPEALERHIDAIVERYRTESMNIPQYRAGVRQGIVSRLQAHEAVRAGLPLYHDLLNDNDPHVRTCALNLLIALAEDYVDSFPVIQARIEVESDESVLAQLVNALRIFSDALPWRIALSEHLLATHSSSDVRLGAANTLVHLQGKAAPAEATKVVALAYAERDEFAPGVSPLHISTPHDTYRGALRTDAGIQGLTIDQIAPMATIMIQGLAARVPQDDWHNYCQRVERICALLFELPATSQGGDTRIDELRRSIIERTAPILFSHVSSEARNASDSAEVLVRLAYPHAARLAGTMTPQAIADLRVAALTALAHGHVWNHALPLLPLAERILTTIAAHLDEQRRTDVRSAEQAVLTAIVAAVMPAAPILPEVEAMVNHYAQLLA